MASSFDSDSTDTSTPVRVLQTHEPSGAWRHWVLVLVALLMVLAIPVFFGLWRGGSAAPSLEAGTTAAKAEPRDANGSAGVEPRPLAELTALPRAMRRVSGEPSTSQHAADLELPSQDPNDLATYFKPGDVVPETGELIRAMNEAGIHDGIAAFNPPGTSPPMQGLRVPDNFALPPGYVRHHQVTDQGEPIDPILMFAPDFEFFDEQGRPVAIPENRVVPPELAPPGMPLEPITIPDP